MAMNADGRSARLVWLITLFAGMFSCPGPAECTSARIGFGEPVPLAEEKRVRGRALFGIAAIGDLYDSVGEIGANFDIGNIQHGDLYVFADLLLWIDNPDPTDFEPQRLESTVEAGYITPLNDKRLSVFIKHQSFHDIDSFDGESESYELYGLRYNVLTDPCLVFRLGKYSNKRVVDYDWDLALGATTGIGSINDRRLFATAALHHVTEENNPERDGFTDYYAETGVEYKSGIDILLRYECLHDLDRFDGTTDHHLLIAMRYVW